MSTAAAGSTTDKEATQQWSEYAGRRKDVSPRRITQKQAVTSSRWLFIEDIKTPGMSQIISCLHTNPTTVLSPKPSSPGSPGSPLALGQAASLLKYLLHRQPFLTLGPCSQSSSFEIYLSFMGLFISQSQLQVIEEQLPAILSIGLAPCLTQCKLRACV